MAGGSGRLHDKLHFFPIRVYYEDTDAAGIVYHANYLKFAERARTEMMRMLGASHGGLRAESDAMFAVRRCAVDFIAPALLDDLLEVETRVLGFGGASIDLDQRVRRDDLTLARLGLRLACVNGRGRPTRVPAHLRAALQGLLSPES